MTLECFHISEAPGSYTDGKYKNWKIKKKKLLQLNYLH